MTRLNNLLVSVEIREDKKEVFARDLTDQYNEPAMYTTSKRGLNKAIEALKASFSETTNFHAVLNTLRDNGIKTHTWCMMD